MRLEVRLAKPVRKQLDAIPREDYLRIYERLKELADAPRPPGCIKLSDDLFRIRCGSYRVIYSILEADKIVLIVKVARRSEKTYRAI